MTRDDTNPKGIPAELRGMTGRTDVGVPAELLPVQLRTRYFVETFYEDTIVKLLEERPGRRDLLEQAEPVIHRFFGCDARLMLAAPWSLKEPIGPVLHVVIYTTADSEKSANRLRAFEREWLHQRDALGVRFVANRIEPDELRAASALPRP